MVEVCEEEGMEKVQMGEEAGEVEEEGEEEVAGGEVKGEMMMMMMMMIWRIKSIREARGCWIIQLEKLRETHLLPHAPIL